ncbi:LysE/ArgO family amino acid transporter [Azospirillum agricola]|uniref:LysE/ArgO family amino acid transporter n=1 Tax=Azospirillum agricola TaxID=1720247 RepID=UPI000A0F220A|nr:LysE/ArgO family amino acid transporter [Azospirillum agricola]MBP2229611.1 L-lysine exporter family protein LysE/ArgO [Azospirillum agricola]SMH36054.1 L-lysine exporter family protein LysE/ArgO [Azospirillum lipoferum]
MHPLFWVAFQGFTLGAGLIIAIGAQNAFVLRQGLVRRHVLPLVLFCALSDALLIAAGSAGFGSLVASSPLLLRAAAFGGAAFLGVYGFRAFRSAFKAQSLSAEGAANLPLGRALATVAAFTFLNPHVYLDTVVLVGGIAGRYPIGERVWFAGGAMAASFAWFTALGYGARLLAPLFARPVAWRVLDTLIGVVMTALAASLLLSGLAG